MLLADGGDGGAGAVPVVQALVRLRSLWLGGWMTGKATIFGLLVKGNGPKCCGLMGKDPIFCEAVGGQGTKIWQVDRQ